MYYLYNGVRLPKLPEWDRKTYPVALFVDSITSYTLYVGSSLAYREMNGKYQFGIVDAQIPWACRTGGTEWYTLAVEPSTNPYYLANVGTYAVWTNTDICYADGTIALGASYPIDAETGKEVTIYAPNLPVLNPTAILMGYSMGAKL